MCTVIFQQDFCGKVGKKFQIGNVYSLTERKDNSCLCMWMTLNWLERNRTSIRLVLMKDLDLGEPTYFLDRVYLGCTQRECQMSKDIVDNYKNMFESRIFDGAVEKLPETRV